LDNADMLLGADFFVSHRVFVANKEHKLFLSYNGGPVFNLSQNRPEPTAASPEDQPDAPADEAKQRTIPAHPPRTPPSLRAAAPHWPRGATLARVGRSFEGDRAIAE